MADHVAAVMDNTQHSACLNPATSPTQGSDNDALHSDYSSDFDENSYDIISEGIEGIEEIEGFNQDAVQDAVDDATENDTNELEVDELEVGEHTLKSLREHIAQLETKTKAQEQTLQELVPAFDKEVARLNKIRRHNTQLVEKLERQLDGQIRRNANLVAELDDVTRYYEAQITVKNDDLKHNLRKFYDYVGTVQSFETFVYKVVDHATRRGIFPMAQAARHHSAFQEFCRKMHAQKDYIRRETDRVCQHRPCTPQDQHEYPEQE
ncbi:hypothetical protein OAM67_01040 [bacterium]|nr:hypothetical protein [bacterium]